VSAARSAPKWPADEVSRRPVDALVPYARNARKHSPEQVDQIAKSITRFGFTIPILIAEDGTIIAGHGRVMAAKKLGLADVPVMVARGWTDEQRRAYTLADNRLAETSTWDEDLLRIEIADLKALDFDLELTGFDAKAIEAFLATPEEPVDEVAEARRTLADRFGVVPFSVLNAREGWWQERKKAWLALGIRSEIGRGENLLRFSDTINEPDPAKRAAKKAAAASAVPGNSGRPSSPSHRDPAFYAKKRAWEAENGRKISTAEFKAQHWTGGLDG
jgi:ParB-like chromosome segregation protein Spo0J